MFFLSGFNRAFGLALVIVALSASSTLVMAQAGGRAVYDHIKAFQLDGGSAQVTNLVLDRDRARMTFTGTFYFPSPVEGRVTGAVFIGRGEFRAEVPPSDFEKANVRRFLKTDVIESDFTSAVLRFSDDTFDLIGKDRRSGATPPPEASKLAVETDSRIMKQTGANISSRIAISILNGERPGFFFSHFNGGKLDRFSYLFDAQNRVPTTNFDLNGGEKGLIFAYRSDIRENDVWMAFYSLADYERRVVDYSDMNDLVDISNYDLDLDLRNPKSKLLLTAKISMTGRNDAIRSIPFSLGESLGEFDDARLKKQLRLKSVRLGNTEVDAVQEDWEGGFTVFLPTALRSGDALELEMIMDGDFMQQPEVASTSDFSYPRSTTTWYPRHGYLDRAEYKLRFAHAKRLKIVCVGDRIAEAPSAEDKNFVVTQYQMDHPIAFATFALGPFVRHNETAKWDGTEETLPLEFNSISVMPLKESFILAELSNSVRYFHKLFGAYPYKTYSASYHPYSFGQGFPSMLMIPGTDRANKYTYAFVSHETGHQWWGNIVAWRSYRDQWLSEGFAEYSGVLYTGLRDSPKASINLIDNMRESLRRPPMTLTGPGKGKLNDVGPIILGHRLSSSKSFDGYQTLVYNKGALVLRMLHFLFTDPGSGSGDPFFDMMRDFVTRYRNKAASTDDFRMVANEHFAKTPIAKRYGAKDLNWFFQQWVYQTHFPSYKMEYSLEPQPDGSVFLTGNVLQENVPNDFFMPLPVLIRFGGDKIATGTVAAFGPKTPFKIKLPAKPQKVELDPNAWVLSEDTSTR